MPHVDEYPDDTVALADGQVGDRHGEDAVMVSVTSRWHSTTAGSLAVMAVISASASRDAAPCPA